MYRSRMTSGAWRTRWAERTRPSSSWWTTSAFSANTRHTARRVGTTLNGSYVALRTSTRMAANLSLHPLEGPGLPLAWFGHAAPPRPAPFEPGHGVGRIRRPTRIAVLG